MEHEIQPALTDREWQNWQRQAADGRAALLDGAIAGKRWDALAAMANALRGDADPGKLTHEMADALELATTPFAGDVWYGLDEEERRRAIEEHVELLRAAMRAIRAILPPRPDRG